MQFHSTWWLGFAVALAACGSVKHDPGAGGVDAGDPGPVCTANQALSCTGTTLTTCNADGTAQVTSACALGCATDKPRCNDVAPSNGLAQYLDLTAAQPDLDLGAAATISTTDGSIQVGGTPVSVMHVAVPQTSGPAMQVFVVKSLVAKDVTISGTNAFAVVSAGDIAITGKVTADAFSNVAGPGGFNDPTCQGKLSVLLGVDGILAASGAGGGGFGTAGGRGGDATSTKGTAAAGAGGQPSGNVELVPLRGGCDSGVWAAASQSAFGGGGGAIQLVSRTQIAISGIVSANGASLAAGGSGGGILLEAPVVNVTGAVVANGASGAAGGLFPNPGESPHDNTTPAAGGKPVSTCTSCGAGGNGGAANLAGGPGIAIFDLSGNSVFSGSGGGGVGRIRINTPAAGLVGNGVFSPSPSTGAIGTR